jgi:uncharacterized membrane protein
VKTAAILHIVAGGAVSGLRSMTGPATALRAGWPAWARVLPVLAIGEYVADKLPFTPSRTTVGPLLFRALSGGFVGSVLAERAGEDRRLGAALGAAAAVAAAYLGVAYRSAASQAKVPPVIAALIEDAVAVGLGLAVTKAP